MHRLISILVVVASTTATAQAASGLSLELTAIDLQGPGITGTLHLSGAELGHAREPHSSTAIALARLAEEHPLQPSTDELGPRYELEYRLALGTGPDVRAATATVRLYPYAEGGPLAYTPLGQELQDGAGPRSETHRLPPGWYRYPQALVRSMARQGLPSRAAASSASGQGTTVNRLFLIAIALGFVLLSRGLRRKSAVLPRRPTSV